MSKAPKKASLIWKDKTVQVDKKREGRIPTFLGKFQIDGTIYDFDEDVLDGGIYRGVSIKSGFPGQGKTSTSIQMAVRQAEAGFRVLYATLEQDDLEIIEKMLGLLSEESFKKWEEVKFKTDKEDFEKLLKEGVKLLEVYLGDNMKLVHDKFTAKEMYEFIKEQKEHFDIIYVDNIQNVNTKIGRKTEELEWLSNEVMTDINNYKKCALVWLSQLTEGKGSNHPMKASINYVKKLEQDAVLRLVIYTKDPDDKEKEVKDVPKTFIGVTKNRKSHKELSKPKKCVFTYNANRGTVGSFVLPKYKEKEKEYLKNKNMIQNPTPEKVGKKQYDEMKKSK